MIQYQRLLRLAACGLSLLTAAFADPVSRLVYGNYFTATTLPASVDGTPVTTAVAAGPNGGSLVAMTSTQVIFVPHQGTGYQFDALVTKWNPDGSQAFSVTLPHAVPTATAVDAQANIYLCGAAHGDFQATPGAFDLASTAGFVAKLDPAGNVLWASRLSAKAYALALDPAGAIFLTGMATKEFQTTPGALQPAMATPSLPSLMQQETPRTSAILGVVMRRPDGARP